MSDTSSVAPSADATDKKPHVKLVVDIFREACNELRGAEDQVRNCRRRQQDAAKNLRAVLADVGINETIIATLNDDLPF